MTAVDIYYLTITLKQLEDNVQVSWKHFTLAITKT